MSGTEWRNICLMVPTYGRADRLLPRFIDSALLTAARPESLRFCFCVDADDDPTRAYLGSRPWDHEAHVEVMLQVDEGPHLASFYNQMFTTSRFRDPATLVSMVGDDMIFRTQGWDARILEAVNRAGGEVLVHCNDAILGDRLCVNLFTTRQLVEATGMPFMCPNYEADMIDIVWHTVGQMANLGVYLEDVVIEHDHCSKYPDADRDATAQRLAPWRARYSNRTSHLRAGAYAAVIAQRLIDAGIGSGGSSEDNARLECGP